MKRKVLLILTTFWFNSFCIVAQNQDNEQNLSRAEAEEKIREEAIYPGVQLVKFWDESSSYQSSNTAYNNLIKKGLVTVGPVIVENQQY